MGLKLGITSTSREIQLNNWKEGKAATWNFIVNDVEVNRQVLNRKWKAEELEIKTLKWKRCEEEIKTLQAKLQEQALLYSRLRENTLGNLYLTVLGNNNTIEKRDHNQYPEFIELLQRRRISTTFN